MRVKSKRALIDAYHHSRAGGSIRVDWATTLDPQEFRQWFRACLHRKISAHCPQVSGRNVAPEYLQALAQAAPWMNNRAIVDWIDPLFRGRVRQHFAKRLR